MVEGKSVAVGFGLGCAATACAVLLRSHLRRRSQERISSSSSSSLGGKRGGIFAGVDVGGTTVSVMLLRETGEPVLADGEKRDIVDRSEDGVIELIASMLIRQLEEANLTLGDVTAVGLGCPGILDFDAGIVRKASNFQDWKDFCIVDKLSKALEGASVILENDANAALLAEAWVGAAKNCSNIVMLTLGTGVGGAIMSDGRILRGANGMAGEIGHTILFPNGKFHSPTGVHGIFESYASASAVGNAATERARAASPQKRRSSSILSLETVTSKQVFECATQFEDPVALSIIEETADYIGIGCINALRNFDPSIILLSGGMTLAGNALLDRVRAAFERHHWNLTPIRCDIRLATAGNHAGVIGAAYAAVMRFQ